MTKDPQVWKQLIQHAWELRWTYSPKYIWGFAAVVGVYKFGRSPYALFRILLGGIVGEALPFTMNMLNQFDTMYYIEALEEFNRRYPAVQQGGKKGKPNGGYIRL